MDLTHPTMDCEMQIFSPEGLVPQQQWDELFDSAFEAIGETSVDIFNEQY